MKILHQLFPVGLFLCATLLPAQQVRTLDEIKATTKQRSDLADEVSKGGKSSAAAITALKQQIAALPLSAKNDDDGDLGDATADIGRRLAATGKKAEAAAFFAQAEQSWVASLAKSAKKTSPDKARQLAALALLRANHLNKPAEAKADLVAALALQPDDAYLKELRNYLASQNAELYGPAK